MSMETYYKNYLSHHGIKGQKWGLRRFQNEDGSYKSGAEGRYDDSDGISIHRKASKKQQIIMSNAERKANRNAQLAKEDADRYEKAAKNAKSDEERSDNERWASVSRKNEERAKAAAQKYSNMKVNRVDRKTIKEAKNYANKAYEEAEFTDYYYKGKVRNYND